MSDEIDFQSIVNKALAKIEEYNRREEANMTDTEGLIRELRAIDPMMQSKMYASDLCNRAADALAAQAEEISELRKFIDEAEFNLRDYLTLLPRGAEERTAVRDCIKMIFGEGNDND